ncbi:VanZ family protein [Paenibacillus chitinolyticus]|uniref:VanZ family protein n=1 Tax=Paenibacillus chitinolyticus TaxID=79263 RepID=UPI003D042557
MKALGRNKMFRFLLVLAWMSFMFYLSSQPYQKQSLKPLLREYISEPQFKKAAPAGSFQYGRSVVSVKRLGTYGYVEFFIRKTAHVVEYAILALLAGYWLGSFRSLNSRKRAGIMLAICVVFAVTDEWHQKFTSQRTSMPEDVILDTCGALLGTAMYYFFLKILQKSRKNALNYPKTS